MGRISSLHAKQKEAKGVRPSNPKLQSFPSNEKQKAGATVSLPFYLTKEFIGVSDICYISAPNDLAFGLLIYRS
jgi:hypothetical protein